MCGTSRRAVQRPRGASAAGAARLRAQLSAVSPQVVRVLRVSGLHRALVVTALPEPAAEAVERASGA